MKLILYFIKSFVIYYNLNYIKEGVILDAETFEKTFWNYYLELEQDYLNLERKIPFDEINYNTFSYKYMTLLLSICSEIDVLFKEYMEIIEYTPDLDSEGKPLFNIDQYEKFIGKKIPKFKNQEITCYNPKFHMKTIYPYNHWKNGESPKWWQISNKIKHHQEKEIDGKRAYKCANQICVLNSLGALFQLNLYIYKELKNEGGDELKVPLYESKLFRLENFGDYYRHIINGKDVSKVVEDYLNAITEAILD